jgi:2-amino-4-hydroxy-6-hydroxymethyldihydropteridine diphosphokinase
MSRAFIGLGSNIGDRQYYLKKAVALIGEYVGEIVAMSSVEETLPVDFIEQPCFLNQIIIIETDLAPAELLSFKWLKVLW